MRAVALLCLIGACADPAPAPVAFERYATAAQDAYCAWAVRCGHVPDDATCRRLLDPRSYDTRRAADGIALGRLRYDAAAAGRCLGAARDAICSAPPFIDAACALIFVGLLVPGDACTGAYDCVGGGKCEGLVCAAPGCCVGRCGRVPVVVPPPVLREPGQTCRKHEDCVLTAYCGDDFTCVTLPTRVGQHCLFGCATGDLYCDVPTETCRAHPALGAACGDDARCNSYWAYCDGVCKPRPGPGEPCDELRRCVPGAICDADAGACAARGGAGAACGRDGDCEVACDADAGACVGYATCRVK